MSFLLKVGSEIHMEMFKGIFFKGYKSFSSELLIKLNDIKNLNIIIGKNNSGKSSVLDVIEFALDKNKFFDHRENVNLIEIKVPLDEQRIKRVFDEGTSGGGINGNHFLFGKRFIGKDFSVKLNAERSQYEATHISWAYQKATNFNENFDVAYNEYWDKLARQLNGYLDGVVVRRLAAERDIVPEPESGGEERLTETGVGASNIIRKVINFSGYDEKLIEEKLLYALNEIMMPEIEFDEIRVQQIDRSNTLLWEIFLREKGNDRFSLSESGSGLKTIILVLLNLLIVPELTAYKGKTCVFFFEELENNLHPALQRSIFEYIYKFAEEHNMYIFLTTHSHIAIDIFSRKEKSQIFHVYKEQGISCLKNVLSYLDKVEILDDLNVKASDILQANGIIWVEGPSDRVYIKKWLEVFCDCQYKEGTDYQFFYYGGRLLSHYTADDKIDLLGELISILTTNRNSAIVIDSDKTSQRNPINATKKRIKEEFEKIELYCWITKGKEIENYIACDAISQKYSIQKIKQCGQYELFPDYIKKREPHFSDRKVTFARDIRKFITRSNSESILDLKKQIESLFNQIEKWNK